MKNIAILLVACVLLSCLTACRQPQTETSPTVTTESTEIATTTHKDALPLLQMPMFAVSLPVVTETENAQDGTLLFKHTYQNMTLVMPEAEVADKVILDFLNKTDLHSEAEALSNSAKQEYVSNPDAFSNYWVQSLYEPKRLDRGVLSLYGSYATYSGGAHGAFSFKSANYDFVTGDPLTLQDILLDGVSAENICKLIIESLNMQKETEQLFDGFETIVSDLINKNFRQNDDWFFSNEGLCFFFSPYEIGPFSSADVVAVIPYKSLINILNEAYFPVEREEACGAISIEKFNEDRISQFSQVTEVLIDEDGEQIILSSDHGVYDISIKTGAWSADGNNFTPSSTVLAAYTLTPGDALVLKSELSDLLPSLQLTYAAEEEIIQYFIGTNKNAVVLIEK